MPNPDNLRQIAFSFSDSTINPAKTPSVTYLIFSEIQTLYNKILVLDELTLFTSRPNYATFTNSTITTLNEQIKKAVPEINANMTSSDILTSSILISQLASDTFDSANPLNTNSTGLLTNSTTEILQVSSLKPIVNANGTISPPARVLCDDDFCKFKGYCVQISNIKRDCKCLPNYSGTNCQISLENKQTFDNLMSNLITATKDQIKADKLNKTSSTGNNVFESLKIISSSVADMNPLASQVGDMADTLISLTQNMTSLEDSQIIVANSQNILNTIDNLFTTTLLLTARDKYYNLEENYKKGQVNATAIKIIPIDLKKDRVTEFSQNKNAKSRMLYSKENLASVDVIVSKAINFAKANGIKAASRTLQDSDLNNNTAQENNATTTDTTTTPNTNNFVLEVLDSNVLQLTQEQSQKYKLIYESIKTVFDSLNSALLNVNKRLPVEIYKFNDFYEYYLSTISDLNNYDFNKFFEQRRLNKLSYFDASACLKSLAKRAQTNNNNNYDFSMVYFVFFNYYYPIFNYDSELLSKSISLSHFIKFYDAEGKEIIVNDCSDNIIHYVPIYPNNAAFMQKYNFYPDKYYQNANRELQGRTYMPFYISKDGAVDRNNDLETQKLLYYKDYAINMTNYDQNLNNYISSSNSRFLYSNKEGYSIAATNSTGEFALFAYYDPVTQKLPNTYFFNYNEIFSNSENFKSNYSVYILFGMVGLFVISFVLFVALKNIVRKFNNYDEWNNFENILGEKDNEAFGDSRAGYFSNLNKGYGANIKAEDKLDAENSEKDIQSEKDDDDNNYLGTAKNKLKIGKKEDEENFKEQVEDSKRDDARVKIQELEMVRMEKGNILQQEDRDFDNNNNLQVAKLRVTGNNKLNNENIKNSDNDNINSKKKDNYRDNLYKHKNLKNYSNNKKATTHNGKCYNIFYFIGKRNIYVNLFSLSSPYDPKYKTICKFAMFIFLQMLITFLLFVYAPFEFSVNSNFNFILLNLLTNLIFI